MSYEKRREIIKELQSRRGSKVISHINSDRRTVAPILIPGLSTQLSTEAQPYFSNVLMGIGQSEKIDFFLYTNGGNTDSVWPLVSLFREYATEFNVIVPYKSFSAGTLICLGANNIILCKNGELSPIDPSTGNPFNPVDEINPNQRKGISVEDVSSYFDLARNPLKKNADPDGDPISTSLAFEMLTANVHPLALGMVNRSHKQIRDLAQRLINSHESIDEETLSKIVTSFTEERYSHNDIFNRKEVEKLLGEDIVHFPNDEDEELINSLLSDYTDSICMSSPFSPAIELIDSQTKQISVIGSFIESENKSYIFKSEFTLTKRTDIPKNIQVQLPSNQALPLIPGLPEIFHLNLINMSWQLNQEGI